MSSGSFGLQKPLVVILATENPATRTAHQEAVERVT